MNESQVQVFPLAVPGQHWYEGEPFPLAWECRTPDFDFEDLEAWIGSNRVEFFDQARRYGAVLFRGFPLVTAEDFDRFVAAFELENFPYEDSLSNAVRVNRTPRVFTANEAPPTVEIFLHHEMAQTPRYPSRLFFFCEKPAEQGERRRSVGPTCSGAAWSSVVPTSPAIVLEKGLTYSNVMPSSNDPNSGMGRSWQSTLRATTRDEAEQRLKSLRYHWEWLDDGCLRATTPILPAVHTLAPGRSSFFNQLIAAYCGWKDRRNDPSKSITFGDGTPLDETAVRVAIELADELTFDIPWQEGDVALVDNLVAMHGRRTFSGTRKILASLACPNM